MSAITPTCAAALPLASWNALSFCCELLCDTLDIQWSMHSFEINVGYYSVFKAKIEKGCIKLLGGKKREKGRERKIKWKGNDCRCPGCTWHGKIIVSFAVTVTLNFPDVHIWKCHKMSWHKLLYFVFCRKGEQ